MKLAEGHGNRAGQIGATCTESVHHTAAYGARFFVHLSGGRTCTAAVHLNLHPRGFTIGIPSLLREYPNPSCTACTTVVSPYRASRQLALTYRTNEVTTDRTREMEAAHA